MQIGEQGRGGDWLEAYGAASTLSVILGDLAGILRAWSNSVYERALTAAPVIMRTANSNCRLHSGVPSTCILQGAGTTRLAE